MRRFATVIAVLVALTVTGSAFALDYGWSLSGSVTDPAVNTLPNVVGSPINVYLHLECATVDGMSAAEFSLAHSFSFLGSFTPMGGALNAGDSVDLLLAVGACPGAGFVAGVFQVLDFTGLGGEMCMSPSPGGTNGTVDCDTLAPALHSNAIRGFTTNGNAPCVVDDCGTVSVESSSWGTIKGLYR